MQCNIIRHHGTSFASYIKTHTTFPASHSCPPTSLINTTSIHTGTQQSSITFHYLHIAAAQSCRHVAPVPAAHALLAHIAEDVSETASAPLSVFAARAADDLPCQTSAGLPACAVAGFATASISCTNNHAMNTNQIPISQHHTSPHNTT